MFHPLWVFLCIHYNLIFFSIFLQDNFYVQSLESQFGFNAPFNTHIYISFSSLYLYFCILVILVTSDFWDSAFHWSHPDLYLLGLLTNYAVFCTASSASSLSQSASCNICGLVGLVLHNLLTVTGLGNYLLLVWQFLSSHIVKVQV